MHRRSRSVATVLSFACCTASAVADFTGFGGTSYVVAGDLHTYHVMEVYATFDDPNDRLFNAFNVSAVLANNLDPGATPVFFQAEDADNEIPQSFLPLGFLPPGEAWRYDSYVTIGAEQGNMFNGTVADPSFLDAKFVQQSAITDDSGWYNLPPTNGFGQAGSDLKVLLGVFVVTAENYSAGLFLDFDATIGYASGGGLEFATASRNLYYPSGLKVPYVADQLDADGISDIVFYNSASRQVAGWLMQDLTRKAGAVLPDAVPVGYQVQGMGDLDANGSTDIVWRDATGRFHAWLTDGLSVMLKAPISVPMSATVQCIGVGDVSGDGRGDIVLRNGSTGDVTVWLMDGFVRIDEGTVGNAAGKVCEAIADFDADGMQDILWRTSAGVVSVWRMNGIATLAQANVSNVAGPVAQAWQVAGAADLSGDGKADVVWRHQTTGMVTGWLMNGTARASGGVLHQGIALQWRIDALRDLNADGKYDIVWRNALNGDVNGWRMDGLTKSSGGFVRNAHPQWTIVVP
jgi:hypothetical protein